MRTWNPFTEQAHSRPSPASDETSRLVMETFRLQSALASAAEGMAREFGLTGARWQILRTLQDGPKTVASTARAMELARQTIQRSVDGLEAYGFVEFRDNPSHKRARLVSLTDKGEDTLTALAEKQAEWLDQVSKDLPPANIRIGIGVLRGLKRRVRGLE